MNYFLIFCSGFTFAFGGINFIVGIIDKKFKAYLYFGILSLAASIFLLAQIPQVFVANNAGLSNTISIITACNWKINGKDGTAQKLGLPPSTLRSKMKKLRIERWQN